MSERERAVVIIEGFLRPYYRIFEWGSGESTVWFSQRSEKVVSIEYLKETYEQTLASIRRAELTNVELKLLELSSEAYVDCIKAYSDEFFDLIFIKGRQRVECLKVAMVKIRRGGLLVFDDSQRERYQTGLELLGDWERMDFLEGFGKGRRITLFERM